MFASFDKGASWRRMKNGLPTVPVFDIQIHPRDHDLIVATHGRSIWIMDDISTLEQWNDQVLTSDLKLFGTRPGIEWSVADYRGFVGSANFLAPNAPNGLLVDYFAKTAGPVQITIADKSGNRVRQLNARAEAGVVNRVVWDLRTDPPVPPAGRAGAGGGGRGRGGRAGAGEAAPAPGEPQVAGELQTEFGAPGGGEGGGGGGGGRGGFGFGGGRGALVEPGEYTVTVSAGGKTDSKTLTVDDDPRVQLSAEDRARRRQAVSTLAGMMREADAARRKATAMNTTLTSLTETWKQPSAPAVPDNVKKAAEDLLARVKTAAGMFENPAGFGGGRGGAGGGAGPPLTYTPPPITQKIGRLMGTIDGYAAAPTRSQIADIDALTAQLKKGVADVNALWEEAPKLNKMLIDAGVPYFTFNLNASAPSTAGRGGN
jgi:hypothetical protein